MHKKADIQKVYRNFLEYKLNLEFNFNQSGVIPYRKTKDGLEVLLITSLKKKKWVIPKGFIEFNLTPFESAKKEAYEEAGILGTNETIELGYFGNQKSIGICHVKVFAMEVTEMLEEYPEKIRRSRKWFNLMEASSVVEVKEISDMISNLASRIQA
ncbi:MAG: NUDIX hydrolase [Ignavibacteriaceae bacterium]|jgi:8-oxo-dGTP pyrophosphatase MutT (NUDIX family)